MNSRLILAALALALTAPAARAHYVWLEKTDSGPVAFFGEWADGLRETQDGYLKIIAAPLIVARDGTTRPATVGHDRISLAFVAPGDVRLTAHYRAEKGDTLVRYHARLGRSETRAVLDLEIVPDAPGSNAMRVLFRGEALPEAEVTLFTSEGWHRKFTADAAGRVRFVTPWPGACVLEVTHLDKTPGEFDGRPHTAVRHVSTLMFTAAESTR